MLGVLFRAICNHIITIIQLLLKAVSKACPLRDICKNAFAIPCREWLERLHVKAFRQTCAQQLPIVYNSHNGNYTTSTGSNNHNNGCYSKHDSSSSSSSNNNNDAAC